ncbi:unnamed protein product [Staurois parvus]|uniref:Uncharacterized protein n=1 Tax=Staurois parvus TaxID=386267 RepID=A0ABN9C8C0_9NEOB|nr:unnamed protein product [Staurois parvus]
MQNSRPLNSAEWPCAEHMHSPSSKTHTKLSMCRVTPHNMSYLEEGEDQRSQDQTAFLYNAED